MTEVLDHPVMDGDGGPAPGASGFGTRAVGVLVALVGAGAMVVGLVADALGSEAAGRALLAGGAGVVIAGVALAAVGPALYEAPGPVGAGRRIAEVLVPITVLALAATMVVGAARPDDAVAVSTDEGAAADHVHPPPAATPDPAAPAASATEPTGSGGHVHGEGPPVPLDAPTQKALTAELAATYEATARYPTVADARAANLRPVGKFAPGSGAHYMLDVPAGFDPSHPTMWLFAGNEPTSPVVGVMFYSMNMQAPPEGYTGPNDHWHMHTGLCLTTEAGGIGLPLPVDKDATKEQCDGVGGRFMNITGWMIHVWSAPGWESPQGVFSHDNPQLVCSDGTKPEDAPLHVGCPGMA